MRGAAGGVPPPSCRHTTCQLIHPADSVVTTPTLTAADAARGAGAARSGALRAPPSSWTSPAARPETGRAGRSRQLWRSRRASPAEGCNRGGARSADALGATLGATDGTSRGNGHKRSVFSDISPSTPSTLHRGGCGGDSCHCG